jgi:hypothetical protein
VKRVLTQRVDEYLTVIEANSDSTSYASQFPELRTEAESLLQGWAAPNQPDELKKSVAEARFLMNAPLTDSELQQLKQEKPGTAAWYTYYKSDEELGDIIDDDSNNRVVKTHAEMHLILRGKRKEVSKDFLKEFYSLRSTLVLKVIPVLGKIDDSTVRAALASKLNAESIRVAMAVRRVLTPDQCYHLARDYTEAFMAEIEHKDVRRVYLNYMNLLEAAHVYQLEKTADEPQTLLEFIRKKRLQAQIRQSKGGLFTFEHKQLFGQVVKPYKDARTRLIKENWGR